MHADDGAVVERNLRIPMPDGVRLAGDLYRPAGGGPWPALLTLIPYHKDGRGGRLDVEAVNRHFAGRGYAALTVDLRGLGSSEGVAPDPFDPREAQDGHQVVEWIAAQPWCDGAVGMWGVSYGGITALAVAATRPPHLRAIVPIHAGADLYHDVVAPGGCRGGFWLAADWGPRMVAYNLTPPLFQDPAGHWAEVWAAHLQANGPWLLAWWEHPRFDAFWRDRVIPVERIECPTFQIGGWRDLYAEATVRDHVRIGAPRRLLMGPWKHSFPDTAQDSPAAGLHEMERWWERWLKGKDNGVMDEPPVRFHVQGDGAGWRQAVAWPPPGARSATLHLGPGGTLASAPPAAGARPEVHGCDPTVGMASLAWDPWTTALDPAIPRDQSADDARSLTFTTPPLPAPLTLVGSPEATLDVAASAGPRHLVARLADVEPGGRSTLITAGWLELAGASPDAAGPVARRIVTVPLRATAYRLAAGHRLRLAVAGADFPRLWPNPGPGTLTVHPATSHVRLPLLDEAGDPGERAAPAWGPLQPAALRGPADLGGGQRWETRRDLGEDAVTLHATKEERLQLDPGTRLRARHRYQASVSARRPDLCVMRSTTEVTVERVVGRTELRVTTVTTTRQVSVTAEITVDRSPFWTRTWTRGLGLEPPR